MDANVRSNVVALDRGSAARVPLAGEVQIVGALAANMALTDMLLFSWLAIIVLMPIICSSERVEERGGRLRSYVERLRCGKLLVADVPAAGEIVVGAGDGGRCG